MRVVSASYSGPLPPPAQLEQYNQIVPGAAERLLAMVEREQRHRHSVERAAVEVEREHFVGIPKRGQTLAVALALVCLAVAAGLFATGRTAGGSAVLAGLAGGALFSLVYGKAAGKGQTRD